MAYHIRSARCSELDSLTSLSRKAFSAGLEGFYGPSLIEAALPFISQVSKPLVRSKQLYIAVAESGAMIGAGGWSRDYHGLPAQEGIAHIRQFVVHPDWMQQGIGRALFKRCLDEADDIVQFECQASLSAIPFYRSLGFHVVGEDDVILPDGTVFPTCLMRYSQPEEA